MIDFNGYILPDLDGGAEAMVKSVEMAKRAVEAGIHILIATPRHKEGMGNESSVMEGVDALNDRLKRNHIPLTVLPGEKKELHETFMKEYQQGMIHTLGDSGKYVLIEFPQGHIPFYAEEFIFDAQMSGLVPILAHPEQNAEVMAKPNRLYRLVQRGALVQLNAESVTGEAGKKTKQFCMSLIEHKLAHFITSDVKNEQNSFSHLQQGYAVIEKKFGSEISYLFQDNAKAILTGESILKLTPDKLRKKKAFWFF